MLAGCSSPDHSCRFLTLPGPQLLYPIPGATGVPTAAGYLVFATADSPLDFNASLVPATGADVPVAALGPPPVPLPTPIATPFPIAKPGEPAIVYGASHPALAASTTYQVRFPALTESTPGCALPIAVPLDYAGSFTTR
jgi:hypothetical protein